MTLCLMMFVKLRIDCVGTEAKMSSKKQDTFFLQKKEWRETENDENVALWTLLLWKFDFWDKQGGYRDRDLGDSGMKWKRESPTQICKKKRGGETENNKDT